MFEVRHFLIVSDGVYFHFRKWWAAAAFEMYKNNSLKDVVMLELAAVSQSNS